MIMQIINIFYSRNEFTKIDNFVYLKEIFQYAYQSTYERF
jgi:hypothetical protein